jgi:hypothetical protein
VRAVLDPAHGWSFPLEFVLLLGLSCAAFALAALTFARVREPPGAASRAARPPLVHLARGLDLPRRDARFRRYLLARFFLTTIRAAEPFYPIFALDALGAPASMVGLYLSTATLAAVLSNLLWQRVDRARGTLFLVKTSALITALTPLAAVLLPRAMWLQGLSVERYGLLPAYLFAGVFLLAGVGGSGRGVGLIALLLAMAPDEERASYVGLVNTALGPVSFLPMLSGVVIDRSGFEPVFLAVAGLVLAGYLLTLRWGSRQAAGRR